MYDIDYKCPFCGKKMRIQYYREVVFCPNCVRTIFLRECIKDYLKEKFYSQYLILKGKLLKDIEKEA